ncbi:hypothetical protein NDU88_004086 [Pleurodeles waltl]|uniref:Uncharacterized protein n=1 Tax=Pleurodeles waltl TaxID=8319 RepID=A0AAV7M6J1_PLEWA|nr:hypothetical protein NDU88_004086 [Pleurodeles waltl]
MSALPPPHETRTKQEASDVLTAGIFAALFAAPLLLCSVPAVSAAWGESNVVGLYRHSALQHSLDDISVSPVGSGIDVASAWAPLPSLHLISQTIMAQHKQTQGDNKKARIATKQLQVAVSKIAKTCLEIGEQIAMIESQANVLETELGQWYNKLPCMTLNSLIFSGKKRILKIGNAVTIWAFWRYKKEKNGRTQGPS